MTNPEIDPIAGAVPMLAERNKRLFTPCYIDLDQNGKAWVPVHGAGDVGNQPAGAIGPDSELRPRHRFGDVVQAVIDAAERVGFGKSIAK